MNLHWLDITTLVLYMAALVGMGFYLSRSGLLEPASSLYAENVCRLTDKFRGGASDLDQ